MLSKPTTSQPDSKSDFWQGHIENCNRSSQTQVQYCKEHSLVLSTFCYWKSKLKMTRPGKARFYPLLAKPAPQGEITSSSAGLSLLLGKKKFRIDISEDFSAPTLKKLVTILDQL